LDIPTISRIETTIVEIKDPYFVEQKSSAGK